MVEKKDRPRPLATGVERIQDISELSPATEGYLRRYRHRVKTLLSDGTRTDVYVADYIDRREDLRDAVGVAIFARAPEGKPIGETRVLLRRQVRYAAWLAVGAPLIAEVICGLIEAPETPEETTSREMWEEAGLDVPPNEVKRLGKAAFVLPSIMTERMFPTAVEVNDRDLDFAAEQHGSGDGSPFEEGADHIVMTLDEALAINVAFAPGGATIEVADMKTELILRRLHQALGEGTL